MDSEKLREPEQALFSWFLDSSKKALVKSIFEKKYCWGKRQKKQKRETERDKTKEKETKKIDRKTNRQKERKDIEVFFSPQAANSDRL